MKKFSNKQKKTFLESIPEVSIENKTDRLTKLCKFNFHYMDFSQPAGQDFKNWSEEDLLIKLMEKLKNYCGQPLQYWKTQKQYASKTKKAHHVLEIYDDFPRHGHFTHPKPVPHDVKWGRFRMGNKVRLIGFIIPPKLHGQEHPGTKQIFDCNTFYVVFLDKDHRFYPPKK
jgi:hypothetical protein